MRPGESPASVFCSIDGPALFGHHVPRRARVTNRVIGSPLELEFRRCSISINIARLRSFERGLPTTWCFLRFYRGARKVLLNAPAVHTRQSHPCPHSGDLGESFSRTGHCKTAAFMVTRRLIGLFTTWVAD